MPDDPLLVQLTASEERWDKGGKYLVLVFEHSDKRHDEFVLGEVYAITRIEKSDENLG